jgi:hypothetical protein
MKENRFKDQEEEQSLAYKIIVNTVGWVGLVYFIKYFFIA